MGTNPLSNSEARALQNSYRDSSELLLGIYENIKEWKEHELQVYSEAMHRGFEQLKNNIEELLPLRLQAFQSPPNVKHRKRRANWRTPNNRNRTRKVNSENGSRNASANAWDRNTQGTLRYNNLG